MRALLSREGGQAAVEMGIILLGLLMLTGGFLDVGRGVYAYNQLASMARYGARWGSVVGGSCTFPLGLSTSDWCNQLSTKSGNFWSQAGNSPLQGAGVACPSYSSTPADWYALSSNSSTSSTSIVGAMARHFDTSSSTPNTILGNLALAVDYTKVKVCVQLPHSSPPSPGDLVTVQVYYPFTPASTLIFNGTVGLNASASWQVE